MKTLLLALALAQTQPGTPKAVQPTTKIIFDDCDPIPGYTNGPTGIVVQHLNRPGFGGLIHVRSNFRREVLQSSSELK